MRIGYTGILNGIKKDSDQQKTASSRLKSFSLSYDLDKPLLYSYAKITIGDRTITTDRAIWDTGATITAISHKVSKQFDSVPSESGTSISATDCSDSDIYLATVELPGGIVFYNVDVWDIGLPDYAADVIIGMDIISQGTLIIETVNGVPMFSFSIEQVNGQDN